MFKNLSLLILGLIMLTNSLAYGIIIPLLYPYAARYGIGPWGLSLLFAAFSIAQFVATPILGRMSDKYGRKFVLLLCLFGTGVSLAMFAMATNVLMLVIARMIDGITGGNISVAQAMIADSTKGDERAKGFAFLASAFGMGFLVGPALGSFLSNWGLAAPFWFAAVLSWVGTVLGMIILHETLPKHARQASKKPLFDIGALLSALFSPTVGIILLISFLTITSHMAFIIGFQSFTIDVLKLTPQQTGWIFSGVGVVNIFMQMVGVRVLLNTIHSKKTIITLTTALSAITLTALFWQVTVVGFLVVMVIYMIAFAAIIPIVTGLLSERTKSEDQGIILGINQSYNSIGQIIGPLLAGGIAAQFGVSYAFLLAAGFLAAGFVATRWLYVPVTKKVNV